MEDILLRCEKVGLRMTEQRRTIATVLAESEDHPDVDAVHRRALRLDDRISIATVYRTLRLFEEVGIVERREFRDGKTRYEDAERDHHDHLIDVQSGEVLEFASEEIERLQRELAARLGFRLVDHRLELYCVPLHGGDPEPPDTAD